MPAGGGEEKALGPKQILCGTVLAQSPSMLFSMYSAFGGERGTVGHVTRVAILRTVALSYLYRRLHIDRLQEFSNTALIIGSHSNMEEARVVIVGAGPAGLVLSLTLAQHGIQVCILICTKF
jgi:hypothetical protein